MIIIIIIIIFLLIIIIIKLIIRIIINSNKILSYIYFNHKNKVAILPFNLLKKQFIYHLWSTDIWIWVIYPCIHIWYFMILINEVSNI